MDGNRGDGSNGIHHESKLNALGIQSPSENGNGT